MRRNCCGKKPAGRGTIPRRRSGARALPEVLAGIVDDAWRGGGEKAWLAVGFRPRRQEPVGAARSGARGGGCSLLPIGSREGDQEQGVDCFLFVDPEEIIRLSLVSVQFIDTLFKGAEGHSIRESRRCTETEDSGPTVRPRT
ncbi:uncharacterized protein LOC119315201 [Triticum dicoccoides]|uniref:uncharacterized protein LOC119315201 n=1 Tax=Triticum dicoccoides TaxID=85692 RepID=UPI001890D275|nr:uncharacterized protein LOC119315201 [Triticum dicoccoides]